MCGTFTGRAKSVKSGCVDDTVPPGDRCMIRFVAAQRVDGATRGSVRDEAGDMSMSDLVALAQEKGLDEFLDLIKAGASIFRPRSRC